MNKLFLKKIIKKKFNLSDFKKPFCSNEKKKFKRYETVNFKSTFFKSKNKKFSKGKKMLIISGPARNGNHIVMSMLDGQILAYQVRIFKGIFFKSKRNEKITSK